MPIHISCEDGSECGDVGLRVLIKVFETVEAQPLTAFSGRPPATADGVG